MTFSFEQSVSPRMRIAAHLGFCISPNSTSASAVAHVRLEPLTVPSAFGDVIN